MYAYHDVDDGSDHNGPETASIGVCDVSPEQRRQTGGATEVGESVGSFGHRHVELGGQVIYHVGVESHHSQLIAHFIRCPTYQ